MKNQELYDISIDEFDKMNEKHVFSEKYKKNKQITERVYGHRQELKQQKWLWHVQQSL